MKKQIGIIGMGYLGKALAQKTKNDYHVIGLTKSSQPNIAGVDHIHMDLNHIQTNHSIWTSDYLILSFPPSSVDDYAQTLKKISSLSSSTIIMISSVSAYAPDQGVVDETTKPHGKTTIIEAEEQLDGENCFILRLGGIGGPDRLIWNYLNGKTINYDEYLHLVHVDDCVQAIQKLLEKKTDQNIFNIVNSQRMRKSLFYAQKCKTPPTYGELLENAKKISNQRSIDILGIEYKEL